MNGGEFKTATLGVSSPAEMLGIGSMSAIGLTGKGPQR